MPSVTVDCSLSRKADSEKLLKDRLGRLGLFKHQCAQNKNSEKLIKHVSYLLREGKENNVAERTLKHNLKCIEI